MNEEKQIDVKNVKTSEDIINYIKNSTFNSIDVVYKELIVKDEIIYVVYNESIADENLISAYVINSIKANFDTKVFEDINGKVKSSTLTIENVSNKNGVNNKNDVDIKVEENVNIANNVINNTTKNIANKKMSFVEKLKIKKENKSENRYKNNNININNNLKEEIKTILNNFEKSVTIPKSKKIDLLKEDIFYFLYSGFALVIYDGNIFSVSTRRNIDRSISEATTENTLKGPKDAFNESYPTNIGLIRKRIKTEKLVLEEEVVGRRSKTKIGVLYIQDIARKKLVNYVKNKLKNIDIDAIIDSNYIVELIEDSSKSNFPTIISTERPDLVSFYLLQGRVALVVENTPFVIVVPAFITDFINNVEDYYQKNVNVFVTRLIRYTAFLVTILTPAIYVALITFDQESIPTQLLLSFTTQREGVPFPAYIEAFIMIFAFEILREGDYRVPSSAGSTLSIVGALILGDAAVSAGIVSPIMIIVIAITTISGLMFSDVSMANALRTWRIIFLTFASIAGLVGVGIATCLLIVKLASTTSMEEPYTYPIAPANMDSIRERLIRRVNISTDTKRQKILTDNLTKYKIEKE